MKAKQPSSEEALRLLAKRIQTAIDELPDLRKVEIPADFAQLHGVLNEIPIKMQTCRYRSPGYESLSLSVLQDDAARPHAVTLIGLPVPGTPLPVIGLDAVALGARWSLLALDLAPTDTDYWEKRCASALEDMHCRLRKSMKMRRLPDFAQHSFSRLALIAAVHDGQEHLVAGEVAEFIRAQALPLLQEQIPATPHSDQAAQHNLAWRRAERANRKEQKALGRLFGEERARRLIEDILFPIPA